MGRITLIFFALFYFLEHTNHSFLKCISYNYYPDHPQVQFYNFFLLKCLFPGMPGNILLTLAIIYRNFLVALFNVLILQRRSSFPYERLLEKGLVSLTQTGIKLTQILDFRLILSVSASPFSQGAALQESQQKVWHSQGAPYLAGPKLQFLSSHTCKLPNALLISQLSATIFWWVLYLGIIK